MKINLQRRFFYLSVILFVISLNACNRSGSDTSDIPGSGAEKTAQEYFSVKINGKLWEAFPSKEYHEYNLSYKPLSRQFSIFAEAADGSRMDLSFHSISALTTGIYPSTKNDNGILSGIFFYPTAKSSDRELASITFDVPVQENTVQVKKIDKSDPKAYVIEGTFAPIMYAAYETNPIKKTQFTEGKFRVIYRPDGMNPAF